MQSQVHMPPKPTVEFTLAAARKVKSLIDEEGNTNLNLRVFITGGGCSGFQYGFTFDETINPDDLTVEQCIPEENDSASSRRVKLLVDSLSLQYLAGAEIDYREDVHGMQFVIRNPNAKTTCGCGSSFAT